MSLAEDLHALMRQLVPEYCPRCGSAGCSGFCRHCRSDFGRIPAPCPRCGLAGRCHSCPASAGGWRADDILAPFVYAPPLSAFIRALKYARQRHLGLVLGRLLAGELATHAVGCNIVVPVPLHPRRLRERHFNQADEIARPVARGLGVPLLPGLVRRTHASAPQAALDRRERWRSVHRAFTVGRRIDGAHIAIVDDVVTTGATVNAIAGALKSAGALRVSVWSVARAVDGGSASLQPEPNR